MEGSIHAFCVAAISSGSGKTSISLGIMRALRKRGIRPLPFKCGPDYIDPGFHEIAAGSPSVNLDIWMMGESEVQSSFRKRLEPGSCAVVEGVMGAFDGFSAKSPDGSSAHLAKLLSIPLILVLDASGMAGTIAAIVSGCAKFMDGLEIAGVIANFVSSESHGRILKEALASHGLPPLLGCIPRNRSWTLPERHLGLVPEKESGKLDSWYSDMASVIESHIDIDALLERTRIGDPVAMHKKQPSSDNLSEGKKPRLGVAMDAPFHFYYHYNLESLADAGVEIVFFSPLSDKSLPAGLDGLYLGGGFPEIFAERLSSNVSMRNSIKNFAEAGRPVYAECGGFMYLCESMRDASGNVFPMCGVLPCSTKMEDRLHRLGYRETKLLKDSMLGPAGTKYRGHEFHWSSIERSNMEMDAAEAIGVKSASKLEPSAFLWKNVFASYVHAHFASNPEIASNIRKSLASNQ